MITHLQKYWHVLNPHVAEESLFSRESHLTDHEIFVTDIELLEQADLLVWEISQPSLWVGYEIWYAEAKKKKVMVFFRTTSEKRVSVMVNWNTDIDIHHYTDQEHLIQIIEELFDRNEDSVTILDDPRV